MDKANEIITKIIKEVLTALYQPFGAAVLMAFVSMFVFLYAKEHGWKKSSLIKNVFGTWFKNFKESSTFRRAFLLVFYSTMILFRTILNRDIWFIDFKFNRPKAYAYKIIKRVISKFK